MKNMPKTLPFDGAHLLRHGAITLVFCVLVAAVQYGFNPGQPFEIALAYSVCIGMLSWAVIDVGRHLFPSATEFGWPQGLAGIALPAGGIAVGYLLGSLLADQWLGWRAIGVRPTHGTSVVSDLRASLLITVLAGGSAIYFFYTQGKAQYLQRQVAKAHSLALESRLKLLEAQLEPHMLFNTLANLRVLITTDPAQAQTMLDHLIDYLRATLGASRTSSHGLQQEFDRLADYLALMAVRMGARLHYTLALPPALAQHPVPSLLLQPLVENAIRHGLEPKVEGGSITVTAQRNANTLVLQVTDTGVGLQAPAAHVQSHNSGFGVAQVHARLQAVYGPAATLELIALEAGGTRASIHIPCTN